MTKRLYYDDSHIREFTSTIVEHLTVDAQPAVILDATYFYPTGGGQPNDLGTINKVDVVDVFTRSDDKAIVHVLAAPTSDETANCVLNWTRRLDHMQHHTGQHILTQAFVQVADAHTVGFHLSADSVTIDLDKNTLRDEQIAEAEALANQIVIQNRPVTATIIDPNDADSVRLRKLPDYLATDGLRVITVEDFDVTACGGTHVAHTGEIGLIKVIKVDKRGDKARVEFRCGSRALQDYAGKSSIIAELTAALTCHHDDLIASITSMQAEIKDALRTVKALTTQLIMFEAERLLSNAPTQNGRQVIKAAFDGRDRGELQILATQLANTPNTIALLGTAGDKAHLIFARSKELSEDMSMLIKQALASLGDAKGGGRPSMAQGGGVPADLETVQAVLNAAEQTLHNM